ncbi:MAG: VWA domain-containing protein [Candidatus Omnitrophica bacterium]|nr:VWA domain-containing protein [Candidatus Omnitrophota bacterium]
MSNWTSDVQKLYSLAEENALHAAVVFMDVLHGLGIDFNVRGFGSSTYMHKAFRDQKISGVRRTYDSIKERDDLIRELSESISCGGSTADGDAMLAAVDDMKKFGAERNVILVLTDGEGNTGTPLSEALKGAEDSGVKVIGIGIERSITYVAQNYKHYVQVPDIEMLPVEFKKILRKEIESWYGAKNLSRGQIDEIEETHPTLDKAANEGRMFALTGDQLSGLDLANIDSEKLTNLFLGNLISIRSPPETKIKISERLKENVFKENVIKGLKLIYESAKPEFLPKDKPMRFCMVVEDEGQPTIVFNDSFNNLIAHSGGGKKTGSRYASIYTGYNSLVTAVKMNGEGRFRELVAHEARDLMRGFHVDEELESANRLYDDVLDIYDSDSAKFLWFDLLRTHPQEGKAYILKYDQSRLAASQIGVVETYVQLLREKYSIDIKMQAHSQAHGSHESLIAVYCTGKDFKGEGHVDISIPEGELKDYILRITGMVNIAIASANIPDNLSNEDVDKYRPIISYIQKQYKSIIGEELAVPDSIEGILKVIKRIILGLPKSYRRNVEEIEEYNRLAKETLTAA